MAGISGLPSKANFHNEAVKDSNYNVAGSGSGGLLNQTKDIKKDTTEAEFGDVWKTMQSQYGAKAEKPRTIKKQMDKDDFLKIMVTQMKNQDPMSPMKADQFATQLAQFTSVEQLQNLNQKMGQMSKANQPLERLAMTSLIGKVVTVDRDRFIHEDNEMSTLNYELPTNAKSMKLSILNEAGEKISTREIAATKKGPHVYQWDGKKDDGMPAQKGNYLFRIEAVDDTGKPIPLQSKVQAPVVGVSFETGEGVLLVGDVKNPTKTSMKNITRIDTMMRDMGGNQNLQGSSLPPELMERFKNQAAVQPQPQSQEAKPSLAEKSAALILPSDNKLNYPDQNNYIKNVENNSEKGFPNGLNSGDTI